MLHFVLGRLSVFSKNWFCLSAKGFLEAGPLLAYLYPTFWPSSFTLKTPENASYAGFISVLWLDTVYGIFESMLKILGSRHFHKFGHVIRAMADVNKLHLGMLFNFAGSCKLRGFYKNCYIVWSKEVSSKIKDFKGGFLCSWKLFASPNRTMQGKLTLGETVFEKYQNVRILS